MPDRGAKYADKKIAYIDRKLRQTYKTAEVELSRKLNAFNKKFAAKDKEKQKQLAEGKISKQQYKDWLAGQVFQKERFETQIKQIQQVMYHHNQYAADIVNNSRFDVFAENYYAEAFKANWIIQGVSWDIYNTQAIQRLLEDEPDLLPKWKIDKEKDYDWNYQKVNNIVKQGIIQGEGVEDITKRLCEDLSTMNENRMRMFARTAITGAQNAGRQAQMEQAADMGIDVEKRWIATPDNRTRDSHRLMDGEEVPYNEEFSNGLEYPGDPAGDPAEVYNCRCTMQSVYPKYEDRSKQWREDVEIDGVPYEEWKEEARERIEEKNRRKEESETSKETQEGKVRKSDEMIEALKDYIEKQGDSIDLDHIINVGEKVEEIVEQKLAEQYGDDWREVLTKENEDGKVKIDELNTQIQLLNEALQEMRNSHATVYGEFKDKEIEAKYQETRDKIFELQKERSKLRMHINQNELKLNCVDKEKTFEIMKSVREFGGVTASNSKEYFMPKDESKKKELVTNNMIEAFNSYPKQWIERSKAHGVVKVMWTSGRGEYYGGIDTNDTIRCAIHELGHHMEGTLNSVFKSAAEFYEKRTHGEKEKWLGKGYGRDEKTRKDNFVDPYMGKYYANGDTELISMGVQFLYDDFDKLSTDKEYLHWIVGLMLTAK